MRLYNFEDNHTTVAWHQTLNMGQGGEQVFMLPSSKIPAVVRTNDLARTVSQTCSAPIGLGVIILSGRGNTLRADGSFVPFRDYTIGQHIDEAASAIEAILSKNKATIDRLHLYGQGAGAHIAVALSRLLLPRSLVLDDPVLYRNGPDTPLHEAGLLDARDNASIRAHDYFRTPAARKVPTLIRWHHSPGHHVSNTSLTPFARHFPTEVTERHFAGYTSGDIADWITQHIAPAPKRTAHS